MAAKLEIEPAGGAATAASGKIETQGVTDSETLRQADVLMTDMAPHAKSIILMINAKRGEPFSPLSGYVLRLSPGAPFKAKHFDEGTLFKGRSLIPLLNFEDSTTALVLAEAGLDGSDTLKAIATKITPEWMVNTTHLCLKRAHDLVNEAHHQNMSFGPLKILELIPSTSCQNSISLVESIRDNEPWILCESHSLPANAFIGALFSEAERMGMSVENVFFHDQMKNYFISQKAVRILAARLMRLAMVRLLLGDQAAERLQILNGSSDVSTINRTGDGEAHYVTNDMIREANRDFTFYSEATEAENGALIYAGPFREMVWVNNRGKATTAIQAAGRGSGVPFDMPTRVARSSALEALVLDHTIQEKKRLRVLKKLRKLEEAQKLQEDMAEGTTEESSDIVQMQRDIAELKLAENIGRDETSTTEDGLILAKRKTHHPSVFSVRHSLIAGPSGVADVVGRKVALRVRNATGTLAWSESAVAGVPVAVPDEVVNYRSGIENATMRALLKEHGVDVTGEDAASHPLLRIVIQALGPVNVMDQLAMWRASESVKLAMLKIKS